LIIVAKKKHTITTVEVDILPSRLEYFERRMEKISAAAEAKDIPFSFKIGKAVLKPLPPHQIPLAQSNQLAGTQQLPSGDWVREVVPVEIKHGELTHTGFEYVGDLEWADGDPDPITGKVNKQVFWNPNKFLPKSEITKMIPQIKGRRENFNKQGSYACDHCNPEGDSKTRHHILLFRSIKDQKVKGKMKAKRDTLDLKEGDLVQVGTYCSLGYTGLDLADIAAFYGRDRAVPAKAAHASPRNPAGWGYKDMALNDYAARLVQFYNMRETEWLQARNISLWELPNADTIYSKGTITPLLEGKRKKTMDEQTGRYGEEGCFVGYNPDTKTRKWGNRYANWILQSRLFDYEDQYYMQPYGSNATAIGSVKYILDLIKQGKTDAGEYIEVLMVDEDGTPVLDEKGNFQYKDEIIPSAKYLMEKVWVKRSRWSFRKGEWAGKILKCYPPPDKSPMVKKTIRAMIRWAKTVDEMKFPGKEDVVLNLKSVAKLGYVGEKTTKWATEMWRYYMIDNFKRRQKADKKKQMLQIKASRKEYLEKEIPGGEWYGFPEDDRHSWAEYAKHLYGSAYDVKFSQAYESRYLMVWMTPTDYGKYADWFKAKEEERKKNEALAKIQRDYQQKSNAIYRNQTSMGYGTARPQMRTISYEPDKDEFLDFMDWGSLKDVPPEYTSYIFRIHNTGGWITQAFISDDQMNDVRDKFRPQMVGLPSGTGPVGGPQPPIPPGTPTPSPTPPSPTPTAAMQPFSVGTHITAIAARGMQSQARSSSTHVSTVGMDISTLEGYCVFVSRPFTQWKTQKTGRTITFIHDGNAYVVFYFGSRPPAVGDYYNLYDVKVAQHTAYKGLKQTVIEDSQGGNIDFVNATAP